MLRSLFGRVLVPREVASEFSRLAGAGPRFAGLIFPTWIEIVPTPALPASIADARLDSGEAAAIALCLNQAADVLLIDESLGRAVAHRLGVKTIGILGVLLDARAHGLVSQILPILDRLEQDAGFWIAPGLRTEVLKRAGELTR